MITDSGNAKDKTTCKSLTTGKLCLGLYSANDLLLTLSKKKKKKKPEARTHAVTDVLLRGPCHQLVAKRLDRLQFLFGQPLRILATPAWKKMSRHHDPLRLTGGRPSWRRCHAQHDPLEKDWESSGPQERKHSKKCQTNSFTDGSLSNAQRTDGPRHKDRDNLYPGVATTRFFSGVGTDQRISK